MKLGNQDYVVTKVDNNAGKLTGAQVVHKKTGIIAEVKVYTQFHRNKRKAIDVLHSLLELAKLRYND